MPFWENPIPVENTEELKVNLINDIKKSIHEIESDPNFNNIEAVALLEININKLKDLYENVSEYKKFYSDLINKIFTNNTEKDNNPGEYVFKYEKWIDELIKKTLTNNIEKNNSDPNFDSIGTVDILEIIIKKLNNPGGDVYKYKNLILGLIKNDKIKSDFNDYIIDNVDTLEFFIEKLKKLWVDTSKYEKLIDELRKKSWKNL